MALTSSAIDEMRTAVAARYVAGRIGSTRIDAVRRASAVALRFEAVDGDYAYAPYEDGNGNGVRTAEIRAGIDRPLGPFERLGDKFPGVRFELTPGAPDADGQTGTGGRRRSHRLGAHFDDERGWHGDVGDPVCSRAEGAVRGSSPGCHGTHADATVPSRQPLMAQPLTDRRADTRFGQPVIAGTQAILRPGYSVSLVDLSSGGALIQGPRPLRPGARIHLQLVIGPRRLGISAHVLRCSVASLDAGQGVQYRGALKFDHRCDTLWEASTLDGYFVPFEEPSAAASEGHPLPRPPADRDGSSGNEQD